jgi:hypothetical protein
MAIIKFYFSQGTAKYIPFLYGTPLPETLVKVFVNENIKLLRQKKAFFLGFKC